MKRNLVVGIWGAAAFIAVLAGIAAVSIAQGGLLPQQTQPMSQEEIDEELSQRSAEGNSNDDEADPTDEATSDEETSDDSTSDGESDSNAEGELDSVDEGGEATSENEKIINTDGGTVMARCDGTNATLVWWVAEQGFWIDDLDAGPDDDDVEITFENENLEIEIEVECRDERPVSDIEVDRD